VFVLFLPPRRTFRSASSPNSYYNAVIMVDLFQFSNSYAPLPDIADVVQHGDEDDEGVTDLRSECENYVYTGTCSCSSSAPFVFPIR
jgi:hypothetical protein